MLFLVLLTRILYFVEKVVGYTYYRDPEGWSSNNHHDDYFISTLKVLYWEQKILDLFNCPWDSPKSMTHEFAKMCMIRLREYAVDDRNNRDEDNTEVVNELKRRGFLNAEGEIVDREVSIILKHTIQVSYKGMHLHFMRLKEVPHS